MVVLFRRRCDAMKDFSIPFPGPPPEASLPPTSSRSPSLVCIVWTLLAFLLGLFIGFTLPFLIARSSVEEIPSVASLPKDVTELHPKLGTLTLPPTFSFKEVPKFSSSWSIPVSQALTEGTEPLKEEKEYLIGKEFREESEAAIIEDNVFFGKAVEVAMPKGFSDKDIDEWREFVRKEAVVRLEEGCGRMQNRLLTFSNGSLSCCRYRQNLDQIQGEIFSFYLSRLLGIKNVPPSALGVVKAGSWQWSGIGNQLALAQWAEERPVVLTKFIEKLEPVSIPNQFRSSARRLHPLEVERMGTSGIGTLVELAQWSDLLIFDYLTANLDRVVNNLYNLQWNPSMMEAPAHNLAQRSDSRLLVFLDNESGLLHGYRLLDKYEPFHDSLLQSLCVFRRSTVDRIRKLVAKREVGPKLLKMFRTFEPELQDYLPSIPEKSIKVLNERLKRVHKQIKKCENLYMNS